MKKLFIAALLISISLCVLAQEDKENGNPDQERIKALVKALGSESWKERHDAEKELKKVGDAAGPALEEAAKSEDLEVAHRAKKILEEIAYLPEKIRKEVDKLIEQLKSKKLAERDAAFDDLAAMDKRVLNYLGKYLRTPSDKKVEIKIEIAQTYMFKRRPVQYKLTIKNTGEKPVWIPGPEVSERGSYIPFGCSEGEVNWSRGYSARSSAFKFLYLAPGETYEIDREFHPYGGYSGKHTLKVNLKAEEGVTITRKSGEKIIIPVEHYHSEEPVSGELFRLPEIVEEKKGRPYNNLSAGLEVKEREIEKGAKMSASLTFFCHGKKACKIEGDPTENTWFVLLKKDKELKYIGNGKANFKIEGIPLAHEIKPEEDIEFEVTIKPDVEPGEYLLICGYTELRPSGSDHFRGEVATNAVKIKIKSASEEK